MCLPLVLFFCQWALTMYKNTSRREVRVCVCVHTCTRGHADVCLYFVLLYSNCYYNSMRHLGNFSLYCQILLLPPTPQLHVVTHCFSSFRSSSDPFSGHLIERSVFLFFSVIVPYSLLTEHFHNLNIVFAYLCIQLLSP